MKTVLRKLRTFAGLSGRDRSDLVRACLHLLRAAALLKLRGVEAALSQRAPIPAQHLTPGAARAYRMAHWVGVAARNAPFRTRCLSRSIALQSLLHAEGYACELRVGVARQGDELNAHAWIEVDGAVINDNPDVHERFSSFAPPLNA